MTTINDLLDTALVNIFLHLDSKSLWSRVNLVCKRWNGIWNNDAIIKKYKKDNTRICQKRFDLPGSEMVGLATQISVYGDFVGCLIPDKTHEKSFRFKLINIKTKESKLYKYIMAGYKTSTYLQLYSEHILFYSNDLIMVYKYDMNTLERIFEKKSGYNSDRRNIIINKKNQLVILEYYYIIIYSDFDINKKKKIDFLETSGKHIYPRCFEYDNDKNVYYLGGSYDENFKVMDDSFNIIHSHKLGTEKIKHSVIKITVKDDRIYLVCTNAIKRLGKDAYGEIKEGYWSANKTSREASTIMILNRKTCDIISTHYFNNIDTDFLCFAKNLIIYKLDEQMNYKHKMIVYDINEKEDVKKIKLDVLWMWEPYRGDWENDWRDVPEYGNIANYNDEKIIIIGGKGLLYFKLR